MSWIERWWNRQVARLQTGRGALAATIAGFIALLSVASSPSVGGVVSVVIFAPILWLIGWGVSGLVVGIWQALVQGKAPDVKVGRAWQPGSGRQKLREDRNARFFEDRGGIIMRRRYWFIAPGTPPIEVEGAVFSSWAAAQDEYPQYIATFRDRSFWWYRDSFYWTNVEDYASSDVKALLFARQRQHERELEHAHAVMAAASAPVVVRKREPIPRDVKHAVWERDGGKCIECGSAFDIQYDHVIPFSMGGANSVENLQLLCGRCNQRKGGRL